jgi:glycosyltransferase involved in cell wall biosynthesis
MISETLLGGSTLLPSRKRREVVAKKVALVSATSVLGGGELYGTTLMAALDPARYRPVVICPPTGDLPDLLRTHGLRTLPLVLPDRISGAARASFSFGPRSLVPTVLATSEAAVAAVAVLRHSRAHLVHINSIKAGFFAAPVARALGLPVVWDFKDLVTPDHYSPKLRRVVVTYLNLFATHVIANSGAIRAELVRAGVREAKVVALHNGIDLARFMPALADDSRARVRAELRLAPNVPVAVIVGRLAPWKGHEVFIQAATRVHATLPQACFLVVGDSAFDPPEYRERLVRMASEGGLGTALRFMGFRDDVPAVMGAADVVVHCSILPEPLGLTPIEAMALGRPVIAAAAGGPLETVADGKTGLLTPMGDIDALVVALLRLFADAHLRAHMGAAGRERAERMFDLKENARAVMDVYDAALANQNGHSIDGTR